MFEKKIKACFHLLVIENMRSSAPWQEELSFTTW